MRLTDEQIELYSRQIILREVGGTGQSALRAACVRVFGAGAAAEICTSYLAGAGIGTVVVDARVDGHTAARVLALPETGRRTRDASLAEASPEHDDGRCDVLLDLAAERSDHDDGRPVRRAPVAGPRLGSILLRSDGRGARLLLIPADIGCPECVRGAATARGPAEPLPSTIALASAGAHAALVACRWLLGIGGDRAARALALTGEGVWVDDAAPERVACPRGCPPPAHPV